MTEERVGGVAAPVPSVTPAPPATPAVDGGQAPYLAHLLRTALTAPGAQTNPVGGRVIAVLMESLAVHGGERVVATYLSPDLREGATFTVRSVASGPPSDDTSPAVGTAPLGVLDALTRARSVDPLVGGVEVVSCATSGIERSAITRAPGGELTFRFPDTVSLRGDPALCAAALSRWDQARGHGASVASTAETAAGEIAAAETAAESPAAVEAALTEPAPVPAETAFLRDALAELTVQVDLSEVSQVVGVGLDAMADELADRLASSLRPTTAPEIAEALAPFVPTAAQVADLVAERVTPVVRELTSRLEQQIGEVERAMAKLTSKGRPDEATSPSDGRTDVLRSRPRRRKRQLNGSGSGTWAAGPPDG